MMMANPREMISFTMPATERVKEEVKDTNRYSDISMRKARNPPPATSPKVSHNREREEYRNPTTLEDKETPSNPTAKGISVTIITGWRWNTISTGLDKPRLVFCMISWE